MSISRKAKPASAADLIKAEKQIQQAREEETQKCSDIIDAALKEFNQILLPEFFYSHGRWRDRVLVVPRPDNVSPMQQTFVQKKSEE